MSAAATPLRVTRPVPLGSRLRLMLARLPTVLIVGDVPSKPLVMFILVVEFATLENPSMFVLPKIAVPTIESIIGVVSVLLVSVSVVLVPTSVVVVVGSVRVAPLTIVEITGAVSVLFVKV